MKMKGIILGNNISGLIWGFYHPDWEVIAPIQDQKHDQYTNSNMVWLHDTPETRKLCIDLGLRDLRPRRAHIGYWANSRITEILTPDIAQALISKKMNEWDKPIEERFIVSTKLSMTSEDSVPFMNVLGIETWAIMSQLRKKVRVTHGYAVEINGDKNLVGISNQPSSDKGCIWSKYDKLVSTIPAPAFWKIWCCGLNGCAQAENFDGLPLTNIILNNKPPGYDDRYEMIYYNEEFKWTRASYLNGKYGVEFTGVITLDQFKEMYGDLIVMDYFVNPGGRLIPRPQGNLSPSSNIIFSGRFAQWDHNITTEYVVKDAIDN